MDDTDKSQLKELVKTRINQLKKLVDQEDEYSVKKMQQDDDQDAALDITINAEVNTKLMENYRAEMVSLIKSLKWLDTSEAGLCTRCGCEIPYTRLVAVPDTRLCVDCASN